jgi:hypothetical protein
MAGEDLDGCHLDVSQAFVHSDVDVELFMRIPKGLGGGTARLQKALYGLKQSSRCFHDDMKKAVLDYRFEDISKPGATVTEPIHGSFVNSKTETCIYNYICDGKDGRPLLWSDQLNLDGTRMHHLVRVMIYVDDLVLAFTKGNPVAKSFILHMEKRFKMTRAPFKWFLNCLIQRDRPNRTIYMSQQQHIEKCIENVFENDVDEVTIAQIRSTKYPAAPGYQPDSTGSPKTQAKKEQLRASGADSRYRRNTASYIWGTRTRPDIMMMVGCCCKYMSNPGPQHERDLNPTVSTIHQLI